MALLTRRLFLSSVAVSPLLRRAPAEPPTYRLQNDDLHLECHASPDAVYLSKLSFGAGNLLPTKAVTSLLCSGTAIFVEGSPHWFGSRLPDPSKITASPNSLRFEGIELGPIGRPIARKNWSLELSPATGLLWRITRTFLESCRLIADRSPALVFATQSANGDGAYSEIPGFLDADMQLNGIQAPSSKQPANGMKSSPRAANKKSTFPRPIATPQSASPLAPSVTPK